MAVTFGYVDSSTGARICFATEPGSGVPLLQVIQTTFPGASVQSRREASLGLARGLAGGARWYMFDWRGTGKSSVPPGPVTFEELVDDMEAVAEAIGEPFDLFAVNDGCAVALAFAVRHPEMVCRMLLAAPGAGALLPEDEWQVYLATADRLTGLMQFIMSVLPGVDPAVCRAMAKETIASQPAEMVVALRRAAVEVNVAELASRVLAPSLLIDTSDGFPEALALAACMPVARAANWTTIGDGTINGAAWRRAWDEHIPPQIVRDPRELLSGGAVSGGGVVGELSIRELDVLRLIAAGQTNREIGEALVLAHGTVSRHVHNILTKLNLPNRSAAATWATARGIDHAP